MMIKKCYILDKHVNIDNIISLRIISVLHSEI